MALYFPKSGSKSEIDAFVAAIFESGGKQALVDLAIGVVICDGLEHPDNAVRIAYREAIGLAAWIAAHLIIQSTSDIYISTKQELQLVREVSVDRLDDCDYKGIPRWMVVLSVDTLKSGFECPCTEWVNVFKAGDCVMPDRDLVPLDCFELWFKRLLDWMDYRNYRVCGTEKGRQREDYVSGLKVVKAALETHLTSEYRSAIRFVDKSLREMA